MPVTARDSRHAYVYHSLLLGYFISIRARTFTHIVPIIALAVHTFQRDFNTYRSSSAYRDSAGDA